MIDTGKAVLVDPHRDLRWDRFVSGHPLGWLTHLSGWARVLEQSFPQITGYHLALLDAEGEIRAVVPLFFVKSLLRGSRLVSVPMGTLCGPLTASLADVSLLMEAVQHLATELGASSAELRTHGQQSSLPVACWGRSDYYRQHFLQLQQGPDELRKKFHRSCVRQKIDRAAGSGLRLRIGNSESDLKVFYRLHVVMRKRKGLPLQPYAFFHGIWSTFHETGHLELLLVEDGDRIPAGLMLLKFGKRVSAEILAHDESCPEKSPTHFLFWEAIRRACAEEYELFDFGRTDPENQPLMTFKKRWGATEELLPTFFYPESRMYSESGALQSRVRRLASTLCRNAPESLQGFVGGLYYRHFL